MIYSKSSDRAIAPLSFLLGLSVFLPTILSAQSVHENSVPLKNWAAPLYWRANQAEREVAAKPVPELQFSGNAVSKDALIFVAITPCRLVDTRGTAQGFNGGIEPFSGPSLPSAATTTFPVTSSAEAIANTAPAPCGVIPYIAEAYSFNVTVIPHAAAPISYVTLWPAGVAQPFVSTLTDSQGEVVSNAAIVPAGTSGGISVFNAGPGAMDLVIDMNGFFTAPTDLNGNTALGEGTLAVNTSGSGNTATGNYALSGNTTGAQNTASGFNALKDNTTGGDNTADGFNALKSNTTGASNMASGYNALGSNTTGAQNTASGFNALADNTIGSGNSSNGFDALQTNTTGNDNTANGLSALAGNTTGGQNTASGSGALQVNTVGFNNTANGFGVLQANTTGSGNLATGSFALHSNTTGSNNIANGYEALAGNTTGSANIGIGLNAGLGAPVGNTNSIYIGNTGSVSDFSGSVHIGLNEIQNTFFASGIYGATTASNSAVAVVIDSHGQLGTVNSSERFKEDIRNMGDASSGLLRLRPVTYRFKQAYEDGSKPMDYGLIAEEVAELYPDLVVKNRDGQIQTVQYQKLTPMLLNELQKQAETIRSLEVRLTVLEAPLAAASKKDE